MENQVVYSNKAIQQLELIYDCLIKNWGLAVLQNFEKELKEKEKLLEKNPNKGYKNSKHSKYRKTIVGKHYILVYAFSKNIVSIVRIKHSSQNK